MTVIIPGVYMVVSQWTWNGWVVVPAGRLNVRWRGGLGGDGSAQAGVTITAVDSTPSYG